MRRREVIAGTAAWPLDRMGHFAVLFLTAVLLIASLNLAHAQTDHLPKVGYLGFGAAVPPIHFQNRMRDLGYSEGKGVSVEYRFADGRPEKLLGLARELVEAKVDVIMAVGDEAIVAARNATRTVPIVMVACDAVTTGFVSALMPQWKRHYERSHDPRFGYTLGPNEILYGAPARRAALQMGRHPARVHPQMGLPSARDGQKLAKVHEPRTAQI